MKKFLESGRGGGRVCGGAEINEVETRKTKNIQRINKTKNRFLKKN
jgi:hypothetical protein